MTEATLRSKIANWPVQYIGITEGSSKHLKILSIFNNSKLCTRYKMTKNDAWCATTVSAAFIDNGMAGAPGSGKLFECVECGCGRMIELAQKQGIWVEKDNYVPKVGDVVMYDWGDDGKGDNVGYPEHVGIVISCNGTTFKVIEGNINNSVGYRTMSVNGKYIRGFIAPKYSKFTDKDTVVTEKTTTDSKSNTTTTTNKTITTDSKSNTTTSSNKTTTTSSKTSSTLNKKCKFKGTVTSTDLNVRSWAGTSNKVLRVLKKGATVEVCDVIQDSAGDDWYYIKNSGKYGFVSADYIKKKTILSSSTTKKTNSVNNTKCKFKGTVTATSLNVRSWAGTEYQKLRSISKGKVVEVYDEVKASTGKTWYYIKESGKFGFVSAEHIARK